MKMTKRIKGLACLLAGIMVLQMCIPTFITYAATVTSGDWNYTVNSDGESTITVTGYNGTDGAASVPGEINGMKVTQIETLAFEGNTSLESVSIEETVTYVGYSIFGDNNESAYVKVESTSAALAAEDINTQFNITDVDACADYLLRFANYDYDSASGLFISKYIGSTTGTTLELPATIGSLKIIGVEGGLLDDAENITNVVIKDSIEYIGDFFSWGAPNVYVSVSDASEALDNKLIFSPFMVSSTSETNSYEDYVLQFSNWQGNSDGTSERWLFVVDYYGSETTLTIPNTIGDVTVRGIQDIAFATRSDMVKVIVGDAVEYIGYNLFSGSNTAYVEVTSASKAFANEQILNSFVVTSDVSDSDTDDYLLKYVYSDDGSELMLAISKYLGADKNVNVPDEIAGKTIERLDYNVFWDCEGIETVTVGDDIEYIASALFSATTSPDAYIIISNISPAVLNEDVYSPFLTTEDSTMTDYIVRFQFDDEEEEATLWIEGYVGTATELTIQDTITFGTTTATTTAVQGIDAWSFSGNTSLTKITVEDGVSYIGNYLDGYGTVPYVEITSNSSALTNHAVFNEFVITDSIDYKDFVFGTIPLYHESDGGYWSYDLAVCGYLGDASAVTVPGSISIANDWTVYSVKGLAFADCSNLETVTLPETLSALEGNIFGDDGTAVISLASTSKIYDIVVASDNSYKLTDVTYYEITLDANGGSVDTDTLTTDEDGKIVGLTDPTRNSVYKFKGWYTALDGGTKVTSSTTVTSDMTLYAIWEKVESEENEVIDDTAKDTIADLVEADTLTDEEKSAVSDLAEEVAYHTDKEAAKSDAETVKTIIALDELFVAANDNISTSSALLEVAEGVTGAEQLPEQDIEVSGLALSAYAGVELDETDEINVYLEVTQQPSDEENTIVFHATPMVVVNGEDPKIIENDDLQTPVTFKIYLNDTYANQTVKVVHILSDNAGEEVIYLDVQEDAVGYYIICTVSEFSEFQVSIVETEGSEGSVDTETSTGSEGAEDASTSVDAEDEEVVETGDDSNIMMIIVVMISCMMGLLVLEKRKQGN